MIFAKVDVALPLHHRFLRIDVTLRAAALGVWLAATCYTRGSELDGFCPLAAIDQIASDQVLEELVRVGLFTRDKQDGVHGITVCKYAEHNETKAEINRSRRATAKRVAKHRESLKNRISSNGVTQAFTHELDNGNVPGSDSPSVSDSDLSSSEMEIRESSTGIRVTADGAAGMAISNWCDGIRSVTGQPVVPPRGGPLRVLLDAIRAHKPAGADSVDWARETGAAYAKAQAGASLSPFGFNDWLSSGRPARGERPGNRPLQPAAKSGERLWRVGGKAT